MQLPSATKEFRVAVFPFFVFLCVLGLPISFFVVLFDDGLNFNRIAVAIGAVGGIIIGLVCSWLFAKSSPLILSDDGISGHSVWGTRRFIRWQDIEKVRPFKMLNLRYLRLYARANSRVTWVAMFQAQPADFRSELERLVPLDSKILSYLQ